MEHACALDNTRDDSAAKHRFESFRLGKGVPSSIVAQKHSHTRSHSRNASMSSSMSSLSLSTSNSTSIKSTNSNDMSGSSFNNTTGNHPAPPSKRNSHHRRRSSVSTRCESAELMGVSVPELPPVTSEDNINLGEKDSIRRRALWALEGKPDVSYSKVEIPELSTPEIEKNMFDFPTKPSFPPGSGASFGTGLNTMLGSKRDSFKHLASSSSSKDQLHTLVEEEEEEEDSEKQESPLIDVIPFTPIAPTLAVVKPAPSRPRPANLSLRPLSLTPDNLISTTHGLPTPSLTPSPRPGLKSFSLTPSFPTPIDESTNALNRQSLVLTPSPVPRRPSLNIRCESGSPLPPASLGNDKPRRRSSISYKSSSTSSVSGLPTPEMTPTSTERRLSGSSSNSADENDFFPHQLLQSHPLSASEQHFLFKSHNALLARITDLERALSSRRRSENGYPSSRPASSCSDVSLASSSRGSVEGEPSDEMLQLIADLKAERDELKRDVDGWRGRVGNLEKQIGVFAKRVETERREAWVARSRVGLLEVEKGTLEKALGVKSAEAEAQVEQLKGENIKLEAERQEVNCRFRQLEEECVQLRWQVEKERRGREEVERELEKADMLATPTPRAFEAMVVKPATVLTRKRGLGFTSVDSESSTTDVESESFDGHSMPFGFALKAVEEECEESEDASDEDNGLAGYEDEEDSDLSFQSPGGSSSSFGSEYDFPRSLTHEHHDIPVAPITPGLSDTDSGTSTVRSRSSSPTPTSNVFVAAPRPTHTSRATLSKTWTFPTGVQVASMTKTEPDVVDRFFGCLEDLDADSERSREFGAVSSEYTYERSKGLFAKGFQYGEDVDGEMPPFLLPTDAGVEAVEMSRGLESVEEEGEEMEDEDEGIAFREAGGIQIMVTPAEEESEAETVESLSEQHVSSSFRKPVPVFEFFDDDEEASVPFNFGRAQTQPAKDMSPPSSTTITPPSSIPRATPPSATPRLTSPSSIPRATSFKPSFSSPEVLTSTPPKSPPTRFVPASDYSANTFVTPPTKRGGTMPSFIPQPISLPSPIRNMAAPTKQKPGSNPTATFIRQPQRKPLMDVNAKNQKSSSVPGTAHVNPAMNTSSLRRCSTPPMPSGPTSEMRSVDMSDHNTPIPTNEYPKADLYSPPGFSSFSSIMSSPLSARLSFQTLTNFIPLSWSPSANPVGSAVATLCRIPESSSSSSSSSNDNKTELLSEPGIVARVIKDVSVVQKRGYVSKEKQLEKLKGRLQRDGAVMRSTVDICRNCEDEAVYV